MELKAKLETLIKSSALYLGFKADPESLAFAIEEDITRFLSAVEKVGDMSSKEDYLAFVDSICELHFDSALIKVLEDEGSDVTTLTSVRDELTSLLTASDSPISFSQEDRDLMVIGKAVMMSLYYQGDPTDQNDEKSDPIALANKSTTSVKMIRISSTKLQKHLIKIGFWHLLK